MTKTDKILSIMAVILIGGGFIGTPIVNGYSNPVEFYQDVYGRMNSETLSGTVYLKNVPVHLEGETGVTQYDLEKWTETVPDVLLQNVSEIYICDFKDQNAICYQFTDENLTDAQGCIVYNGSGRLFIDINATNKTNTIIHEAMHRYDEVNGLSDTQLVKDLFVTYSQPLSLKTTDNAKKDEREFLSEVSELYFISPEKLKTSELQPVYDYFQSLFHYYM